MSDNLIRFIIRIFTVALSVAAFSTLFWTIIGHFRYMSREKRERLAQEAIANGHVVNARLAKTKRVKRSDPSRNDDYIILDVGIYEYEYKGKTYRSKLAAEDMTWPNELTLYYIKNPKKATAKGNIGLSEIGGGRCFLIVFAVLSFFELLSYLGRM